MGGRQLLTIAFSSLVCVGYANTKAHAGWFGPSTYDECILDEMKGRPSYMMETVKRDCTAKFCTEEPLTYTEEEKVAFAAAVKKSTDKCKSEDEASPNYYTRMLAPICGPRPFLPTARLVCK
jgi:hypothetical protein